MVIFNSYVRLPEGTLNFHDVAADEESAGEGEHPHG